MSGVERVPNTIGEFAQQMARETKRERYLRLFTGRYLVTQGCENLPIEHLLRSYPAGEEGSKALVQEMQANYMAPELTRFGFFMFDFLTTRSVSWLMERLPVSLRTPRDSKHMQLVFEFNLAVRTGSHKVVMFDAK